MRKKEILPFATTWVDLENIMLSEIKLEKMDTVWYRLYVEFKKTKLVKKRERDKERE